MASAMSLNRRQKFSILTVLMVVGASVYALPYMRFSYYTPLQTALGLLNNNKAYGDLSSIYGLVNLICYLPGGYIADKFSSKKLLVFSMLATGGLGVLFGMFPPYPVVFAIHALWGITTVLTFWAVYIKYVNLMSASDEQGEMFGWLEGGRGVLGLVISLGGLQIYKFLGAGTYDVRVVIFAVSGICILAGILTLFFVPDLENEKDSEAAKVTATMVLKCLKLPGTWVAAAAIFMTYVFVGGASYLNPYLELAFGMTAVLSGSIAAIRSEGMKILSAPSFGRISKHQGRSTGILSISFIVLAVLSLLLLVVPSKQIFLIPMVIIVIAIGFFSYGNRGVYWALVDEFKTPKYMAGTMIGVISILGFIPDAFIYSIFGGIMDKFPGLPGFKMIFGIFLGCALVGGVTALIGDRVVKRLQKRGDV